VAMSGMVGLDIHWLYRTGEELHITNFLLQDGRSTKASDPFRASEPVLSASHKKLLINDAYSTTLLGLVRLGTQPHICLAGRDTARHFAATYLSAILLGGLNQSRPKSGSGTGRAVLLGGT